MGRKYYQKKMENSMLPPRDLADTIVAKAVTQPTPEEQARAERLAMLENLRITTATKVEAERYALSVDGVGFFALDDIHGLKGKQKAGKSAVLKVCAAALLSGQQFRVKSELEEPVVLFIDTEQQAADVKLIIDELKLMTHCNDEYIDSHLLLFPLRRMSYDILLSDTRLLIQNCHPQVVFIDGLVDYVASFNDEEQSRQLIHDLLVLCEEYHCAIVNVLHENKSAEDANMRGHLGTVLAQKAGTVLQCQKNKNDELITVTCPDSRHGAMPTWSIKFDNNGHLINADLQRQQQLQAKQEQRMEEKRNKRDTLMQERLEAAKHFLSANGGSMTRAELNEKMQAPLHLDRTTVSKLLTKMVNEGMLFEANEVITLTAQTACPF